MSWRINRYNKKSSKRYGWHPSWFDDHLVEFDSELIDCIKWFQLDHDLEADGLVGPLTFRRLLSERDLKKSKNHILINNQHVEIDWDVKIDLMPNNCYRKWRRQRKPNMIVTHWDATTSAEKCKRVLQARNISTHFCIDNDGIIYQYVDTNDVAWHAGGVNKYSIGIDFSNAYYLKYNDYYVKKGFNKRPICKDSRVHGVKLRPHLGYYPVQIKAYKKLVKVLCDHYDIPIETPMVNDEVADAGVRSDVKRGKFDGIVCHYHASRNKIDCAGLDLKSIVDQLR
jgi:N-acetyl-anhydromuramyl-L-alanine amidase AmpD